MRQLRAAFVLLILPLAAGAQAGSAGSLPSPALWQLGPWQRAAQAPVIRPDPSATFADPLTGASVHWEALNTFNPAAIVRHGKVYVLYRAEDDSGRMEIGGHVSRLGMAVSTDGVHFTQSPRPVFYAAKDDQKQREADGGVEDPRLVEAPDGTYVLAYTQYSRTLGRYSIGIATSPDLLTWTKHGPAFQGAAGGAYDTFQYKSAGIVTERRHGRLIAVKIHGKFWMYWGEIEVGLATSDDLVHWTPVETAPAQPLVLLRRRDRLSDSAFPETGPPAVLTPQGIVLLYNAKNAAGPETDAALSPASYSVQEALFSSADPGKLLARTEQPVFQPELAFERAGQFAAGTTFAEGLVWFRKRWWLYYGCADSLVGVATAPK